MIIIAAVDNSYGLMFNHRRQSTDRVLRAKILEAGNENKARTLWMNAYSAGQFTEGLPENVRVDESFLDKAEKGDYCFVENRPIKPYADRIEGICLFKWNRDYPSDFKLDYVPAEYGFHMTASEEFPGYSHQKITLEVWTKPSGQK